MNSLKNILFKITDIDEKLWVKFKKNITISHYKKGDFITVKNNIWTNYMYLNSGMIRSYYTNDDGKEFTRQFYFNTDESNIDNLFVTDLRSLLLKLPSLRTFEVMEDCELYVFSYDFVTGFCKNNPQWDRIARTLIELTYIQMDEYYCRLLTHTPKEHYLLLKSKNPKLCKMLPQYHIASFLGITPVTLSRIRKNCD